MQLRTILIRNTKLFSVIVLFLCSTCQIIGQILPNNPEIPALIDSVQAGHSFTSICTHRAEVDEEVFFTSGAACGPNLRVQKFVGFTELVSGLGIYVLKQSPLLVDSPDPTVSYSFSEPGVYVMGCNNKVSSNCIVVTTSANELDPPVGIPTMDEWGILILLLVLLIFAVRIYTMQKLKEYEVSKIL